MQLCTICGVEQPIDSFWTVRGVPKKQCKDCETSKALFRLYGISLNQYNDLLDEQGGVCAVCGIEPTGSRLHVDHDHETGFVRGLLCFKCNSILGKVNDDPEHLLALIAYLEDF